METLTYGRYTCLDTACMAYDINIVLPRHYRMVYKFEVGKGVGREFPVELSNYECPECGKDLKETYYIARQQREKK